jgi:hypothetical protein
VVDEVEEFVLWVVIDGECRRGAGNEGGDSGRRNVVLDEIEGERFGSDVDVLNL